MQEKIIKHIKILYIKRPKNLKLNTIMIMMMNKKKKKKKN